MELILLAGLKSTFARACGELAAGVDNSAIYPLQVDPPTGLFSGLGTMNVWGTRLHCARCGSKQRKGGRVNLACQVLASPMTRGSRWAKGHGSLTRGLYFQRG